MTRYEPKGFELKRSDLAVAIVGAGIQGIALALELAANGVRVELFEAREKPMQEASRENEGKIHLGFVYANDVSAQTSRLMIRGAFAFAPTLSRWLERGVSVLPVSRPFTYLVHRDSLLDPSILAARYAGIGQLIRDASQLPGADYFGRHDAHRMRRLSSQDVEQRFSTSSVAAAFESSEIAVDPIVLADLLASRVFNDPRIRVRNGMRVVAASQTSRSASVTFEPTSGPSQRFTESFDHVFNCSWSGRLLIDATLGIKPNRAWSFRRKHFLRIPSGIVRDSLVSATIVLGAFGDVVQYPSGELFLSWYPAGCQGIETGMAPGASTVVTPTQRASLTESIVRNLGRVIPGLQGSASEIASHAEVRNGVIFALGTTDIDDPQSRLHSRNKVGIRSFGNYHTVDTGKYTLAPLFAREIAQRITGARTTT